MGRGNNTGGFFFSPFFFKHYYLFLYLFYKQASLRWRALCLTEWQFTNTIISTNPLSSLLRSLDCQTTQQPLLRSKPLFTLSSPTANHLRCLQMTCSFIEARANESGKLFSFVFAKMYKCDKWWETSLAVCLHRVTLCESFKVSLTLYRNTVADSYTRQVFCSSELF